MNPDIKRKWVDALRSGDYTQGNGALRAVTGDGTATYCCLGVLCEIYRQETGLGVWVPLSSLGGADDMDGEQIADDHAATAESSVFVGPDNSRRGTYPPTIVSEWAGRSNAATTIVTSDFNLADLNDTGQTFTQIADTIEEYA